jgi:GT2 family glycosyltransferase
VHRLWPIVQSILAELRPRVIVEVGAGDGANTENLLGYAAEHDAVVHVVDVIRGFDPHAVAARRGASVVVHWQDSLDALPDLAADADLILLDGDHNWYTARQELAILDEHAERFPVCVLHDVGWPYGRRDGYQDPAGIPAPFRQPHARLGIRPGVAGTVDKGGLSEGAWNALVEGGPRNGVRTAVDDLLSTTRHPLAYAELPGFHGMGILGERDTLDGPLAWLRALGSDERVVGLLEALESARLEAIRVASSAPGADTDHRVTLLNQMVAARDARIAGLTTELAERSADLQITWTGRSWRLTEPLRRLASGARATANGSWPSHVSIPLASLDWDRVATRDARRPPRWGGQLRLGMRTRWALEHHPPTSIVYRVDAPAGCVFVTDVATRPEGWSPDAARMRMRVSVRDRAGDTVSTTEAELDPHRIRGHRGWKELSVPLPGEGGEVELVLDTQPVGDGWPVVAVWGDPQLLVPRRTAPFAAERTSRRASPASPAPSVAVLMPVHDPRPEHLERAIASVLEQTHGDWQLCIADDGSRDPAVTRLLDRVAAEDVRVLLHRSATRGGIAAATNAALSLAGAEYVALLDHDDELDPQALEAVVERLRAKPDTDVIYTDEDRMLEDGSTVTPVRKPGFSPDFLRSGMYTCHLSVYRRELVEAVGGMRSEFDGSQDLDLMLRVIERTQRVGHIPRVLYHWRAHEGSASLNPGAKPYAYDAARRAIDAHLARTGKRAHTRVDGLPGHYRVVHEVDPDESASVVLALDAGQSVETVIQSVHAIADGTPGPVAEIVCAGPASAMARLGEGLGDLAPERLCQLSTPDGSGWAATAGAAARQARGKHLLLLDRPCAPLGGEWLTEMIGFSAQSEVGAVGALVSREERIVHGGVLIGEGLPLAAYRGAPSDYVGYLGALVVPCNYSAVAGAVMTRRELFLELGGMRYDTPFLGASDYCLRAGERGLRVVFQPLARLEALEAPGGQPAPVAALAAFKSAWDVKLPRDPHYHPDFCQVRAALPAPLV